MRIFFYLAGGFALLALVGRWARGGGARRRLRLLVRRLRIALILAGIFMVADAGLRLIFPAGWVGSSLPLVLAVVLGVAFLALAQDPKADI